jgi:RNA polymerase sigma-70 factor, ECF subfamily
MTARRVALTDKPHKALAFSADRAYAGGVGGGFCSIGGDDLRDVDESHGSSGWASSSKGNAADGPRDRRAPLRPLPRHDGDATKAHEALDRISSASADDDQVALLVVRAQGRDDLAFAELYILLFDRVYRYLCKAVKNEQDAQEIAQDVFAKLLVVLPSYDATQGQFRVWLFSIARHMALDHLRKASRADTTDPRAMARHGARVSGVATLRERFDPADDVASIVDSLPEAQRRVVVLRFVFSLTATEIAEVVGTTADAVRHTQHRALRAIGSRLKGGSEHVAQAS